MITPLIKLKKICLYSYFNVFRSSAFIVVIISLSLCNSSDGKKYREKKQKIIPYHTDSISDSCSAINRSDEIIHSSLSSSCPYDLDHPDEKYSLPMYLEEVSGLAYYKQDKILCVQDEKANIYILDLNKGKIESQYDFTKDGDYEDIAIVDETAYVIRNDGCIFGVENFNKKSRKVKEHKTPLSERNDTEGLTYDKISNSLFIACKGSPAIFKDGISEGYKAIYKFDIEKMELDHEPIFLIDLNRLDNYKDHNMFKEYSIKIAKKIHLIESETSFQPSGIAIHPLYGEIYIISNIGKLLIILSRQGKVMDIQDLDIEVFRQPEGICFSPSGDMFIANEGQGGNGYILKFNLQNNE